jgi:hypothetical protein
VVAKLNDYASLFERQTLPTAFVNDDEELDAVALRKKGMVAHAFSREAIARNDPAYAEFVDAASERGLMVIHQLDPHDTRRSYVFVLEASELWRVPAYLSFQDAMDRYPRYNSACEYLQTRILGYSDEQIGRWMEHLGRVRAGSAGMAVYLLLTTQQLRAIQELGMRAFPPASDIQVFWHREMGVNGNYNLRADASTLVPEGLLIGRVAIHGALWKQLFESLLHENTGEPVLVSTLRGRESGFVNQCVSSNIEILYQGKWTYGAAALKDAERSSESDQQ